jgi:hypothetical protein
MATDEATASTEANPSDEGAALRARLISLLEDLPETRLSKTTPRLGWTLRHELSWLAAADEELRQRLELTAAASEDEPRWRRIRGEAMHEAQELRLAALTAHLEASGTSLGTSLERHAARLNEPAVSEAQEALTKHLQGTVTTLEDILGR